MKSKELKVILLRGIPASGKSTWAKQKVLEGQGKWKRVNKDDLRNMIDAGKYSKEREKFILDIRDAFIIESLIGDYNVIVDDTNLHSKHVEDIQQIVDAFCEPKPILEIKWFPITLDDALARDECREASVGKEVIQRMYKQYVEAGGPEPEPLPKEEVNKVEWNMDLPISIISDIDGTLAKMVSRGPYEQNRCGEDEVWEDVANTLYSMKLEGYNIILVSGRSDKYIEQTKEWLDKHCIYYDYLYMRKEGDFRKDWIVKKEIYDNYIRDKFNVLYILDDRTQIVKMWRSLGIRCFQVDWGNF